MYVCMYVYIHTYIHCCSQGGPLCKMGYKIANSIAIKVKVGQTQRWLISDERIPYMIKKEPTKSRCNYEFKSSRFKAKELEVD